MHTISKLAEEHLEVTNDVCVEHGDSCVTDAYVAGFRKARELAVNAVDSTSLDPTGRIWEVLVELCE